MCVHCMSDIHLVFTVVNWLDCKCKCKTSTHKVVGSNPAKLITDFTIDQNKYCCLVTESQFIDLCDSTDVCIRQAGWLLPAWCLYPLYGSFAEFPCLND